MIDTDKYEGHSEGPWYWDGNLCNDEYSEKHGREQWCVFDWEEGLLAKEEDMRLIADAPILLAEVKRYRLKDCAITQAKHMRAQVGDNTWHYAMEVWLYPLTHYWEVEDELALIESFISTNRDAWVKHWGEPSEVVRKRGD